MPSVKPYTIAGRAIGPGLPPYIIAEVGINHGGDADTAKRLLRAAAEAGADAVKLQAYKAERFLQRSSQYYGVLKQAELEPGAIADLMKLAKDLKVTLFASVFDEASAELMERLGAPAYKIASGDITHLPLLRHVARFGKPMIISTGGATMAEIRAAVEAITSVRLDTPIALLHCVSNYPTESRDANLACMATIRREFGRPVGFSDHTMGVATSIAAVALGAELVEKHFTLDRTAPGPDHALSADPLDLAALVSGTHAAWSAIGRVEKMPVEAPDFIPLIRRSITAAAAISAGTIIRREMLDFKRPGTGIPPTCVQELIGSRAIRDIAADELLSWDALRKDAKP